MMMNTPSCCDQDAGHFENSTNVLVVGVIGIDHVVENPIVQTPHTSYRGRDDSSSSRQTVLDLQNAYFDLESGKTSHQNVDKYVIVKQYAEFIDVDDDSSFCRELSFAMQPLFRVASKLFDQFLASNFFDRYVSSVFSTGFWRSPVGYNVWFTIGLTFGAIGFWTIATDLSSLWAYTEISFSTLSFATGIFQMKRKILYAQSALALNLMVTFALTTYNLYAFPVSSDNLSFTSALMVTYIVAGCMMLYSGRYALLSIAIWGYVVGVLSIGFAFSDYFEIRMMDGVLIIMFDTFLLYIIWRLKKRLADIANNLARPFQVKYDEAWLQIMERDTMQKWDRQSFGAFDDDDGSCQDLKCLKAQWLQMMSKAKSLGHNERSQLLYLSEKHANRSMLEGIRVFNRGSDKLKTLYSEAIAIHPIFKVRVSRWAKKAKLAERVLIKEGQTWDQIIDELKLHDHKDFVISRLSKLQSPERDDLEAFTEFTSKRGISADLSATFWKALMIAEGNIEGEENPKVPDLKSIERAVEKVHRAYGGDVTRLCDLVRCSIVCRSIAEVFAVLREIEKDKRVCILYPGDSLVLKKFRFDYQKVDSSDTLGYRDTQLSIQLRNDPAAIEQGVSRHICEVQIHMENILAIKDDEGHMIYKKWRNLRAC